MAPVASPGFEAVAAAVVVAAIAEEGLAAVFAAEAGLVVEELVAVAVHHPAWGTEDSAMHRLVAQAVILGSAVVGLACTSVAREVVVAVM
jgi:hypothetical protein